MHPNIVPFPQLKKPRTKPEHSESDDREFVKHISNHYTEELIRHLYNHGVDVTPKFLNDMNFVNQFISSAILRSLGRHHQYQDFIDDIVTMVDLTEEDLEENDGEE